LGPAGLDIGLAIRGVGKGGNGASVFLVGRGGFGSSLSGFLRDDEPLLFRREVTRCDLFGIVFITYVTFESLVYLATNKINADTKNSVPRTKHKNIR